MSNKNFTLYSSQKLKIFLFAVFLSAGVLGAGGKAEAATKVLDYGFEDWTGDASTTPNYFSSNAYLTHWETHLNATEVVQSGNTNCGGRSAHSGNYYFHQGFYDGAIDPCLGTAPTIDPHTNIGYNGLYPPDPKNNLDSSSDFNISDVDATDAPNATFTDDYATVIFADEANDDFHLAPNDTAALGNGTDLSADSDLAFTDDIDNENRSRWDIGADEMIHSSEKIRGMVKLNGDVKFK